jgi:hypothetical protein
MRRVSRFPIVHGMGVLIPLVWAASLFGQTAAERVTVQYAHIVAKDYAFEAPTALTEGIVTFHLMNEGADVHQLVLIELGVGHTIKEFFDAMRAKGQPPSWTVEVAMTPTILPNQEAFLTARLVPGRYILGCLIPARDGRSHVEKGMSQLVTVLARRAPAVTSPARKPPA